MSNTLNTPDPRGYYFFITDNLHALCKWTLRLLFKRKIEGTETYLDTPSRLGRHQGCAFRPIRGVRSRERSRQGLHLPGGRRVVMGHRCLIYEFWNNGTEGGIRPSDSEFSHVHNSSRSRLERPTLHWHIRLQLTLLSRRAESRVHLANSPPAVPQHRCPTT